MNASTHELNAIEWPFDTDIRTGTYEHYCYEARMAMIGLDTYAWLTFLDKQEK